MKTQNEGHILGRFTIGILLLLLLVPCGLNNSCVLTSSVTACPPPPPPPPPPGGPGGGCGGSCGGCSVTTSSRNNTAFTSNGGKTTTPSGRPSPFDPMAPVYKTGTNPMAPIDPSSGSSNSGSSSSGGSSSGGGSGCGCQAQAQGGDPISMKTGEFQYSFATLTIPGPIPVQVIHSYGNQRDYDAYYGPNWTINYDMKIVVSEDTNTITLYDSRAFVYEYQKISTDPDLYTLNGNPDNYIVEATLNTYDLVLKDGLRYHFQNTTNETWPAIAGTLEYIIDEQGNRVYFGRDSRGRIGIMHDCVNRLYYFSYSDTAPYQLIDIRGAYTGHWSFSYDSNTDNLVSITYPETDDFPGGLSYEMDYDDYHNLTHIYDPNDDLMLQNYYEYDSVNEVYKAYGQDIAEGNYQFIYDEDNNVAEVTDPEGHFSRIYYTDEGQISKRIVYTDNPSDDPNSFRTEYIYNSAQQNTRIIYPKGNCVDYIYNQDGYIIGVYRKTLPSDPNDPDDPNVIATLYTYVDSEDPLLFSKVDTATDPEGNVTDYDYNEDGLVTRVTLPDVNTPSGLFSTVYEYTYYDTGDPNTFKDPNGVITKYVYYDTTMGDPNNTLLWKEIVDYGEGPEYLNLTTEYAYDELQRVRMVKDPNGAVTTYGYNNLDQLTEIVNALGYKTKASYDYNGHRKKIQRETSDPIHPWQTTEKTYNTEGKVTKVKDAMGHETLYGYDNNGYPTSVIDELNQHTAYAYNERGLLDQVTDPNGGEIVYTYDDNGNRLTVTDPNGMTTTYEYDGFDRVIKITDAEGHYRTQTHDKKGHVLKEIAYDSADTALMQSRYTYNAAGDLIQYAVTADADSTAAVDPNDDRVTEYSYAWANGPMINETTYYGGVQATSTDSTAATTYHTYDMAGRKISSEDPDGNTTGYWYDENGSVTRIQEVDISTADANDVITLTTDFIYDDLGQLVKRIEKPQNPDAASDVSWQTTEYEYDKLGNRTKEIRPNGVEVTFEYDLLDRKIKMSVDPADANQVTEYGYDALGRQIWILGSTDDTDVDTEQVTQYTYDDLSRITKITYPDNATIEYTYNAAGKVISRTDQRGIVTYFRYDDTYNMTEKQVTMDSVTTIESFTYDGLGRMLTATKYEGASFVSESEFAYSDIGQISGTDDTYFTLTEKHTGYTYDNAGNRIITAYPLGTVHIDRTNTWDGRIDTIKFLDVVTVADYEYIGSRVAARNYSMDVYAVNTEYSYDNLGRTTHIYTYIPGDPDTTVVDFDYDYINNENNIQKKTFDHRSGSPYNEYTYDTLDRLTEADYLVGTLTEDEVFTMDDLGNRTNVNLRSGSDQVYDVNDLTNRYTSVASNNCTYDAAGNMTVDPNGYQYAYDYENRIVEIKDSGSSTVAEYAYDALGRRIKVVDSKANGGSGETTYYYYNDQWQVLVEYASYDTWKAYNIFGNYIDETLLRGKYGISPYVYAHDHLYSTVAAVNINAVDKTSIFERYEYDAYGNAHVLEGNFTADADGISDIGNPYTFTGRRLDVLDGGDLNIMYYRNRYYSPELGRFMTHDPWGGNKVFISTLLFEINQKLQYSDGMNIYNYGRGNPMMTVDSYGLNSPYPIPDYNPGNGLVDCKRQPEYDNCMNKASKERDKELSDVYNIYLSAKGEAQKIKDVAYDACEKKWTSPTMLELCKKGADVIYDAGIWGAWAALGGAEGGARISYGVKVYGCQIAYSYYKNKGCPTEQGDECDDD